MLVPFLDFCGLLEIRENPSTQFLADLFFFVYASAVVFVILCDTVLYFLCAGAFFRDPIANIPDFADGQRRQKSGEPFPSQNLSPSSHKIVNDFEEGQT